MLLPPARPRMLSQKQGFALITVLLMLAVLGSLLAAYLTITRIELATMKAAKDSSSGFYAAEGGLNLRAETIRATFVGYNTPSGQSPSATDPCTGSNLGSGDFSCQTHAFGKREAVTYVIDHQNGQNPQMIKIPQGELYQNLNAQEYRYTANSRAFGPDDSVEAILDLRFKSRLVPLFQFAVFYNKDLEILPGPAMVLSGAVHTNGDLYLNSETSLDIAGQVTVAGSLYRGRKDNKNPNCNSTPVRIKDPTNYRALYPACPARRLITKDDIMAYNGMIQFGIQAVTVPEPEMLDPAPGALYWDKADLRIALHVDSTDNPVQTSATSGIEIRNPDNSINAAATTTLFECAGSVRRNPTANDAALRTAGTTYAFRNNREGKTIRMLDIDLRALFDCLYSSSWFGSGRQLSDNTEGGLVMFFTVDGPKSGLTANPYGVRLRNGENLSSSISGAPAIRGLTVVTDQAVYVQGNYNSVNKKPAAILADSLNVLSNSWYDSANQVFRDNLSTLNLTSRTPSPTATTHNFAVLSGTDTTGGIEGAAGQDGSYNGGVENYPRFHENWTGVAYTYRGSFVSLNRPRHVAGAWVYGNPQYNAPNRNWDYDTSFNNAANLPPITPRFVYLRQELFVRDYEQ